MAFFSKKKKEEINYESEYEKLMRKMEAEKNFNFREPITLDPKCPRFNLRLYDLGDYILKNYVTIHKSNGRGKESDEMVHIDPFKATLLIGRSRIEIGSAGGLLDAGIYMYFQDQRLPIYFSFPRVGYKLKDGSETNDIYKLSNEDVRHGYYEAFTEDIFVDNKGISMGLGFGQYEVTIPERLHATHVDHHSYQLMTGAPMNSTVGQYEKVKEHTVKKINEYKFVAEFPKGIMKIHQMAEGKISYNNNRYKKNMEYFKENDMPEYNWDGYTQFPSK
ncbi:MAG: hypothetical protein SLAVMIC_00871 [uncultured marine phage]|uniref:Uncharacterized protein n=1 Tax=uncultured marine phage TaxID=707152 RepID=A0A8D9CCV0_9VIRU|nr:MAG: hypothetical protein SLAVMIC_00871 [uncultured marine phage]